MFNNLNEHPLFNQRKFLLNGDNPEKLVAQDIEIKTECVKRKENKIEKSKDFAMSKSKSVSDLLSKGNISSHCINDQIQKKSDRIKSKGMYSSFYLFTDNKELECEEIDNDKLIPFPIPRNTSFIRSRTDLNNVEDYMTDYYIEINSNDNDKVNNLNSEKRLETLNDFILKQKQYMIMLKMLIHDYYFEFVNKFHYVNPKDRDIIFNHIMDIYEFHRLDFLPDLERKRNEWYQLPCQNRTVCDVFIKHGKKIHFYNDFVDNFNKSVSLLNKHCNSNFNLKSALCLIDIKVENKYSTILNQMKIDLPTNLTLKSLLTYVQTWPDIANKFLTLYENHLSLDHSELNLYVQITEYFNELASKSIDSIEDTKRDEILLSIQNRIGYKFNILDKKRVLVKQGPLVTLSPHLGIIIRVYLILMNDLLIICDQTDSQYEKLKPKRPLDVIGISVSDDPNAYVSDQLKLKFTNTKLKDTLIVTENGFSINVPVIKKVFRFYARNLQEKLKWYNAFVTIASINMIQTDIDRSMLGKIKPRLIPNKLSQYCFKCKSEFSPTNLRHHCKACGFIFCKNCARAQTELEYEKTTKKKMRVCDYCYDFMYANMWKINYSKITRRDRTISETLNSNLRQF